MKTRHPRRRQVTRGAVGPLVATAQGMPRSVCRGGRSHQQTRKLVPAPTSTTQAATGHPCPSVVPGWLPSGRGPGEHPPGRGQRWPSSYVTQPDQRRHCHPSGVEFHRDLPETDDWGGFSTTTSPQRRARPDPGPGRTRKPRPSWVTSSTTSTSRSHREPPVVPPGASDDDAEPPDARHDSRRNTGQPPGQSTGLSPWTHPRTAYHTLVS